MKAFLDELAKIHSREEAVDPDTLGGLSRRLVWLQHARDAIRHGLKEIEAEHNHIGGLVLEKMDEEGFSTLGCNGMTIYQREDFYCSAKPDSKQEAVDAFRENEMEEMVAIQAASAKAWIREKIDQDGEPPEWIKKFFNFGFKRRAVARK